MLGILFFSKSLVIFLVWSFTCSFWDLVRSGLDDTMRSAYIAMSYRMHAKNKVKDLRTSAMSIALEKIALSYDTLGL